MGLIAKAYNFIAGTPAQSAQVNSDLDTIYAEFNGNITDPNVNPAANIQQSKIQNLPATFTSINNTFTAVNTALNSTLSTVSNDAGEPGSSFVGEAQLYTPIFVQGGALGTSRYLFLSQDFLMNINTNSNCQLRYYYGGTLFFAPTITNVSGITQNLVVVHVDASIHGRNQTQGQYGIGRAFIQSSSAALNFGGSGLYHNLAISGIAVDSTLDQNIQINVVWDQPGNLIVGVGSSCWMVK